MIHEYLHIRTLSVTEVLTIAKDYLERRRSRHHPNYESLIHHLKNCDYLIAIWPLQRSLSYESRKSTVSMKSTDVVDFALRNFIFWKVSFLTVTNCELCTFESWRGVWASTFCREEEGKNSSPALWPLPVDQDCGWRQLVQLIKIITREFKNWVSCLWGMAFSSNHSWHSIWSNFDWSWLIQWHQPFPNCKKDDCHLKTFENQIAKCNLYWLRPMKHK